MYHNKCAADIKERGTYMPENTGRTNALTNEERINQRIESSIKNDGIADDMAEKFLHNEQVKMPALRFAMLQMLSSVEEGYAQRYFNILAYLEEKVREKELLLSEIGDLSQSYFRTVKKLSDVGYPMEKLDEFLSDRLGESGGEYPTPCELSGLCISFQEERRQAWEENKKAVLNAGISMDKIQEKLKSIQSVLEGHTESMKKDHGIILDMEEQICKILKSLENTIDLYTESVKEISDEILKNGRKLEEYAETAKEERRQAEGMILQLEEKLENAAPGIPAEEQGIRGRPHGAAAFFKRLRERADKKKQGKDSPPPDINVKGLIYLLKENNCPQTVRDKVKNALNAGVSMEETYLAVQDAYKEGGGKEEMLMDVLDILILCRRQKGVDDNE